MSLTPSNGEGCCTGRLIEIGFRCVQVSDPIRRSNDYLGYGIVADEMALEDAGLCGDKIFKMVSVEDDDLSLIGKCKF
ncbi:hypothetical protein Hdeb2414_s0001g00022401 [Helianthus debilis subsp. tardiflorus]